ncbi:MAG: hypothetical protein U9R16_05340 [Campylobacterota bacterium]|nr:hypothetical protein [Campylobacterota bacterium]
MKRVNTFKTEEEYKEYLKKRGVDFEIPGLQTVYDKGTDRYRLMNRTEKYEELEEDHPKSFLVQLVASNPSLKYEIIIEDSFPFIILFDKSPMVVMKRSRDIKIFEVSTADELYLAEIVSKIIKHHKKFNKELYKELPKEKKFIQVIELLTKEDDRFWDEVLIDGDSSVMRCKNSNMQIRTQYHQYSQKTKKDLNLREDDNGEMAFFILKNGENYEDTVASERVSLADVPTSNYKELLKKTINKIIEESKKTPEEKKLEKMEF